MAVRLAEQVTELINHEDFAEIRRVASRRPLLWEEFARMRMPLGLSAESVWETLTSLRRQDAIYLADLNPYNGSFKHHWYTSPFSLTRSLMNLSVRSCVGSDLDLAIRERASRHFFVQPLIEESIAAVQREGFDLDYETARSVLLEERRPENPGEQLLFNLHAVLWDLERYAGLEITPDLIAEVHSRIVDRVDTTLLPSGLREERDIPEWPRPSPSDALDHICANANGRSADPDQHPIITSFTVTCGFWRFVPLRNGNFATGSIISRLFLLSAGYPVFRYIPTSGATLAWKKGLVAPPIVHCAFNDAGIDCGSDRDWTPYFDSLANLIVMEFDRLERTIASMRDRDQSLCRMLRSDTSINIRQRDVLNQALLVPETKFRIRPHGIKHGVAYSTARVDLYDLVQTGFLSLQEEGGACVFVPRPDLRTFITRRVP